MTRDPVESAASFSEFLLGCIECGGDSAGPASASQVSHLRRIVSKRAARSADRWRRAGKTRTTRAGGAAT